MHITFPTLYPSRPPRVEVKGFLRHPNVFGGYVCLDMLRTSVSEYSGWSSAYTVPALLHQLYGFLLADESVQQEHNNPVFKRQKLSAEPSSSGEAGICSCGFEELPLGATSSRSLETSEKTGAGEERASSRVEVASSLSEKNLFCFYSKARHDDGETVLGYPLDVVRFQDSRVKSIGLVGYDYLSLAAFAGSESVRRSAWNKPFNDWLPLYINPSHGSRALSVLPGVFENMLGRAHGHELPSTNAKLFFTLAKVMNSLVVELFVLEQRAKRHLCDAVVQGFFHLHHLLLAVTLRRGVPFIEAARSDLERFVRTRAARHKSQCPDLGLLLLKLLIVPTDAMPWGRFAPAFMRELFCRQVRWVRSGLPERTYGFDYFQPEWDCTHQHDRQRVAHHLQYATTGMRVVALEAWFANAIARPSKAESAIKELSQIKASLDRENGQPGQEFCKAFWDMLKVLEGATQFQDYMDKMGIYPNPRPTQE
uniref:Ubiquitinconjugating enzyme subfamily protein n=1 Tax=Tetraselmis sp. GSL018 TaxID=582737 RepID=A0A061RGC8_9CHLO